PDRSARHRLFVLRGRTARQPPLVAYLAADADRSGREALRLRLQRGEEAQHFGLGRGLRYLGQLDHDRLCGRGALFRGLQRRGARECVHQYRQADGRSEDHQVTGVLQDDDTGATIVEFALIAPVALMLLLGMFDLGYNLYTASVLQG